MKRFYRLLSIALLTCLLTSCGIFNNYHAERKYCPAPLSGTPEQVLTKKGFVTSYNSSTRLPNWVYWHMTSDHVGGSESRFGISYHEDTKVAKPRATLADYRRSGYTRGHMCPAADCKWSRKALKESFALTNICPQTEKCNSGVWNSIETQCREWVLEYGDLYVVCGPIYDGVPETIGDNRVAVPDGFFKVVACLNGKKKGIAFICDNVDRNQTLKSCVASIEDVERMTGIEFFPNLNAKDSRAIKERGTLRDW